MANTEQSSILPPAPEQLPPLREDYAKGDQGKLFHHAWTRWFLTIREKVNVVSASLVNLGNTGGIGFMVKDGDNWAPRTIKGTSYTNVTNGDGVGGDPVIDLSVSSKTSLAKADSALQAGNNVSSLTNDAGYINYTGLKGSLVAGAHVILTPDDSGKTITIASTGSGGGGGGSVDTVTGGAGVSVNNADPGNPVVSLTAATLASLALADSATQPGDLATVATSGAYSDLIGLPNLGTAAAANTSDFDAAGTAVSAVSSHVAASDPHTQYAKDADLGGMATIDDAPADGKTYGRKDGDWAEITEGGGGVNNRPAVVQSATYVGSGPPSFTLPTAPSQGNVLLIMYTQYDYSGVSITSPWSYLVDDVHTGSDDYVHAVSRGVVPGDTANIGSVWTGGSNRGCSCVLMEIENVTLSLSVHATYAEGIRATLNQSVTVNQEASLLLSLFATTGNNSYPTVPPANATLVAQAQGTSSNASLRAISVYKSNTKGFGTASVAASWSGSYNTYGLLLSLASGGDITVTPA